MILYKLVRKLTNIMNPSVLRGGVLSITFDDQWHSAYCNALPLLNHYGFKSTWYICVSNIGVFDYHYQERSINWGEIRDLQISNHEIASHTMTHCDFDCTNIERIREELGESRNRLMTELQCPVNNFAYPFTRTGKAVGGPSATIANYASARGGEFGLNSFPLRRDNLFACKLYEKKYDLNYLKALIDLCVSENKWLIFYTHDVKKNCSDYGCTPELFRNILQYVFDQKIRVETVDSVIKSI